MSLAVIVRGEEGYVSRFDSWFHPSMRGVSCFKVGGCWLKTRVLLRVPGGGVGRDLGAIGFHGNGSAGVFGWPGSGGGWAEVRGCTEDDAPRWVLRGRGSTDDDIYPDQVDMKSEATGEPQLVVQYLLAEEEWETSRT